MKFIVTGSEGFIGKALTRALEQRGNEVIGIDRKNGDEAKDIAKHLEGVDGVYHLAAQTSVFNDNLEQIKQDNIDTFMAVCDACRIKQVKLVYASSSTANGCNTTSMYGISKHFNEQYASKYYPKATGVRLHNVYGPNPRQGTLLWYLLNEKKVTLYNGGENVRHFTYIDDVIEGFIYAYGSNRQLINIANPEKAIVLNFASLVKMYNGVNLDIVEDEREFDNFSQSIDNSIYNVPLSYTSLSEGIATIMALHRAKK